MLCQKCKTKNNLNSLYCTQCGASLRYGRGSLWAGGVGKWLLGAFVLVWVAGLAYLFKDLIIVSPANTVDNETVSVNTVTKSSEKIDSDIATHLSSGQVTIQDKWGGQISRMSVAVIDEALVALPVNAIIGGYTWLFESAANKKINFDRGFWKKGNAVGLWFLEKKHTLDEIALASWEPDVPLKWQAFSSNEPTVLVTISQTKKQGMFIHCSVPESLNTPGVFFQKDKIVGWTFGAWSKGGYLLASTKSQLQSTSIEVKDFYEATFANGREEQFAKVLATGQSDSAIDRLLALSKGFQFKQKLSLQETPSPLHPDAIRKQMFALVAQVVEEGTYRDLLYIFSDQVLLDFLDIRQLPSIIYSAANRYGYKNGIQLLETVSENLNSNSLSLKTALIEIHARLYKEWIQSLLDTGDIRTGWQIFIQGKEYHPNDYEIQLLGVELALAEMDWQEAERLLNAMDFPAYLSNKLRNLYARVSDLKAQEGKIEIRFPPGHKVIPVTARLNDSVEQNFLIDTGASMVTIPTSSIDILGIEIDEYTPKRLVSTAGGVKPASEVILSSIELKGWTIYDVKALVLDIPGTPNLGLLGLNFLSSFQMDLDTEKGVLVLEPK